MGKRCYFRRWLRMAQVMVAVLAVCEGAARAEYDPNGKYYPPNANSVAGSRHDMAHVWRADGASMQTKFDNFNQVCVYCHTPHNATKNKALWNRYNPTATYVVYTSFVDRDTTPNPTPNLASLMCLSCHDGTLPIDMVGRKPRVGVVSGTSHQNMYFASNQCGSCHSDPAAVPQAGHYAAGAYLGQRKDSAGNPLPFNGTPDLSDDHPISMLYPSREVDPGMKEPPDAKKGWETGSTTDVKLVNGYVECVSCHDPHRPGDPRTPDHTYPFLRKTNNNSELCLTCHDK